MFSVNSASGAITVVSDYTPDYETQASYAFTVTATDANAATSTSDVTVSVTDDVNEGTVFALTTSADSFVGTDKNDTINGAKGTVATADTVLDSSTTDADVANFEVTSAVAAPRLSNIETLNIVGKYATTGIDLASTSGTTVLNLSASIPNGTATVTNAASLNAESIVAGTNIATLNVTTAASGTRDTVTVDAGAASLNLTVDGGADTLDVTVAADTTVVLIEDTAGDGSTDTITLNLAGSVALTGDATIDVLNINNEQAAATITLTTAFADEIVINAAQDVTIKAAAAALAAGTKVTTSGAGTVTAQQTDATATASYEALAVDVLELTTTHTGASAVDVNEGITVNFDVNHSHASLVTLDQGNATAMFTAGEGSLLVTFSEDISGTGIATDAGVGTLIIEATPDETSDTDTDDNGTDEDDIDVSDIQLDALTTTLIVTGAADLTLALVTTAADSTISAADMTGSLTITDTVGAFDNTFYLGSGNDTVSDTVDGQVSSIYGNAGNDTITTGTGADKIYGGAGNDTITAGGTAGDTIDGGAGDDTITAAHADDKITLGAGADTVTVAKDTDIEITDFNVAEDTLVITGTATAAVDITSETQTSNKYELTGTGDDVTLTNITATDLSSFVQLGNSTNAFIAFDTGSVKAGAKDDYIQVATTTDATVTTGAGSDIVHLVAGSTSAVIVDDFTVGSDKIIISGTATVDTSINLSSLIAPTAGLYKIDDQTTSLATVTLSTGGTAFTATDLTDSVQLGATGAAYTADANGGAVTITGGDFDDVVIFSQDTGGTATYAFTENGGMDTVSIVRGANSASILDFNGITDISDSTGTAIAADAAKLSDASDGSVYVFADSTDGTGSEAIATFTENTANGITADAILADVAAFLDAALGNSDGETYVALINDGGTAGNAYAYLVDADTDGIDADNIKLIGTIDAVDNAVLTIANI